MAAYGADADSVAAYLPVSGQTVTHFTIRKERGLPNGIPIIDEFAPVNKARKDTAPVVLITGDKNLEMADRYEENALLASVLKNIGNRKVSLYELQGFDHGQVLGPACYLIVNYILSFDMDNVYICTKLISKMCKFSHFRYQKCDSVCLKEELFSC